MADLCERYKYTAIYFSKSAIPMDQKVKMGNVLPETPTLVLPLFDNSSDLPAVVQSSAYLSRQHLLDFPYHDYLVN